MSLSPASTTFPTEPRYGMFRLSRPVAVLILGLWGIGHVATLSAQEGLPPGPSSSQEIPAKPSITDALLQDRPIGDLRASLTAPTPAAPENLARPRLAEAGVALQPGGLGRGWCLEPFEWDATAMRHRPTYFEEPNLERMGYYYGAPGLKHNKLMCKTGACAYMPEDELLQPLVSAARFYGRVVALPYMMGVDCPLEEVYSLGEDRPGSCVPYRTYLVPLSLRGAIYQGAAATGIAYIIP